MRVQVAGFLDNSTVNGQGMRSVVFLSGCSLNCPGCHNKEQQSMDYGDSVELSDIISRIRKNKAIIDGVTISGGDPFEQIDELLHLLKLIKEEGLNICVYTGRTYEELLVTDARYLEALNLIDTLIDGPYIEHLKTDKMYIGSSNQRILML